MNGKYQNRTIAYRIRDYYNFIKEAQNISDGLKAIDVLNPRKKSKVEGAAGSSSKGRSKGKGNLEGGSNSSDKGPTVRIILNRYKDLPTLNDDLKAKLRKENKCYRCRDKGYGSFDPKCIFYKSRSHFKFGNINKETPITNASIDVLLNALQTQA